MQPQKQVEKKPWYKPEMMILAGGDTSGKIVWSAERGKPVLSGTERSTLRGPSMIGPS